MRSYPPGATSTGRDGIGNPIRPDLHARLWALSREVAEEVGTAPAAEIRLLEDTTIAVTEEGGLFTALFSRGHRVLLLGLPTLVELSVADLRSILYHEYAHFAHGDTRWAVIPYHLANTILHALSAVVQPASGVRP